MCIWTALAICGGIALESATYLIMKARLLAAQADVEYYKRERNVFEAKSTHGWSVVEELESELFDIKADRDQLAQELKDVNEQLELREIECCELGKEVDELRNINSKLSWAIQNTKVARDPKTGRMVSMKSK
jgi:hypothetical protein